MIIGGLLASAYIAVIELNTDGISMRTSRPDIPEIEDGMLTELRRMNSSLESISDSLKKN